jgi:hypothetical protein
VTALNIIARVITFGVVAAGAYVALGLAVAASIEVERWAQRRARRGVR